MTKPNPIAESFAEMTARIRQDERLTVLAGLWKHIHLLDKRFVDLAKSLDELRAYIPRPPTERTVRLDMRPLHEQYADDGVSSPKPAPKRKAVTATAEHVNAAWDILRNTDPKYSFLGAEDVAANWAVAGGKRIAGAALRELVLDGQATVKRGKYAQAQPPAQTADGATSEAP